MSSKGITLFILFLHMSLFPDISGLNQEGLSLLSWISTLHSSSSFSSWNQTHKDPCRWDYVKCSSNGFVSEITITSINLQSGFPFEITGFSELTSLVISNANLTGEIPSGVGNLSALVTLDLSFNALTGTIPQEIGGLSSLQWLLLNSNSLEGRIPSEISNCSNLRQVELFDNFLSGKIPAEIGLLRNLEIFRAGGNPGLPGEIPMQISNCSELVFLGLADTGISGEIPISIGELQNLQTFSVYTANLTGHIPSQILNCTALENLFVYENQITGKIPDELGSMKNLKRVLLWQNNLSGSIPASIGNCSSLVMVDFSLNSLTGEIPMSLRNLYALEVLLLSYNSITGEIPNYIGNFSSMKQLELDNNRFSGTIPALSGEMKELTIFFAWQNQLHGSIPSELSNCEKLQAVDLSHNFLTGSIPSSLFHLRNLTQLLLISNRLSGAIPPDIGHCISLIRLRLGSNNFSGRIPPEIGHLRSLTFLELSENTFNGEIPNEIGDCTELEMLDLHSNKLQGSIPFSLEFLTVLNVLDLSMNRMNGRIPGNLGNLKSLNKLILRGNHITGAIPRSLGLCKDLQLIDLSSNTITGSIPDEIGELQALDILLNLSWNVLTGPIPERFSNLSKLANLDLSHNYLVGSLGVLSDIDNLVSLNVSYNNFSGLLPDTKFFQDLPVTALSGNPNLCVKRNECHVMQDLHPRNSTRNIVIYTLVAVLLTMVVLTSATILVLRVCSTMFGSGYDEKSELQWVLTPFQKLNFSVTDIVTQLSDSNIIGEGCSGVVYKVETPMKQIIAVKKLYPSSVAEFEERDMFSAEVQTLGSIRHKNIVRLLGYCNNGKTKLLLFDYICNGSLSGLLHRNGAFLDWDSRYNIIVGTAQGLEYLHHHCIPPIVHRDIKTNNILVGPQFEAFLADFGLAKLIPSQECSKAPSIIAGSYGYIAPEYGHFLKITEKVDVYSYGVVLLEVLTGMEPSDDRISDCVHIVVWVNREIREKRMHFTSIIDQQLLLHCETRTQEMLQVLGIALLCVNTVPEDRPTMRDVTAMLKEIRNENEKFDKSNSNCKEEILNSKSEVQCSSFNRSCEPLIQSSSSSP